MPHSIDSRPDGTSTINFDYGVNQFPDVVYSSEPLPSSYADLRDLPPFLNDFFRASRHTNGLGVSGSATPHGLFDLCVNSDYSLDTMDFSCVGQSNKQIPFVIEQQEPLHNKNADEQAQDSVNAFGDSVCRFTPQQDNALNLTSPRR